MCKRTLITRFFFITILIFAKTFAAETLYEAKDEFEIRSSIPHKGLIFYSKPGPKIGEISKGDTLEVTRSETLLIGSKKQIWAKVEVEPIPRKSVSKDWLDEAPFKQSSSASIHAWMERRPKIEKGIDPAPVQLKGAIDDWLREQPSDVYNDKAVNKWLGDWNRITNSAANKPSGWVYVGDDEKDRQRFYKALKTQPAENLALTPSATNQNFEKPNN